MSRPRPAPTFSLEEIVEVIGGRVVSAAGGTHVVEVEDGVEVRVVRFDLAEVRTWLTSTAPGRSARAGREALMLLGVHIDEFLGTTFAVGDPVVIDADGIRLANPVAEAFDDVAEVRSD